MQYLPCQMYVFSNPRHQNLDPRIIRKSNLEIDMEKLCFPVQKYSKSSQNGSPKSTKKLQNPSLDFTRSFLVPSNVLGSSQDRPRITQDTKVEAQSMPNDTHGHQNPKKIRKDPGLDLKVSLLCSPVSQNRPRVPQVRQSEATNHAK